MSTADLLQANLLSPYVLAFGLGVLAKLLRSDLALPKDVYTGLSIYLLFALGLKGGVELSEAPFGEIFLPAVATLALGVVTPVVAYAVLRRLGRLRPVDAAAIAAHYGSVSAVTFIAAQTFVRAVGETPEPYLATLLALLESPGIAVGLGLGLLATRRADHPVGGVMREVFTGRTMLLLVGGLIVGALTGKSGYEPIQPFYEGMFRGALTLFLLEMGLLAAERLSDLKRTGPFLVAFGVMIPVVHGALGAWAGTLAGLSPGGAAVLGAMAASASYIAAPPAVRMTLPEANPTYYLTASLAITFPFNLVAGIPLYYWFARLFAE
ncbi:MAG TPA: sodium-dependent bicarbonate transport family permease [Gemmatimonadales bacterium]